MNRILDKYIRYILFLLISFIPLFGFFEILQYFGIAMINRAWMVYFKAPKDVLLILLIWVAFIRNFQRYYNLISFVGLILFFGLTFLSFFLSWGNVDPLTLTAGFRWSFPFLLLFLMIDLIDEAILKSISKILIVLLFLNTGLQFLELIYMPPFFGYNYFGGTGRLPGFFSQASAAGIFAAMTLFFVKYFYFGSKVFIKLVCLLSIVLAQSTLGFLIGILVFIFPFIYKSKYSFLVVYFSIPIFIVILLNINLLTGRGEGDSEESIHTRLSIFAEMIEETQIFSTKYGIATNTAKNMDRQFEIKNKSFISDSMYTSVFVNFGLIGFIIFILGILSLFVSSIIRRNEPFLLFVIIFALTSVSIITSEIYPGSLLFPLVFAFFIRKEKLCPTNNMRTLNE